jgi:dihydrofolate reductase
MSAHERPAAPPRDASLELIVAVAANGVIGRGGTLPWHLPDDLKHFKALTMGHPILMGRRTYESIGKPLPGRRSIVMSKTISAPPAPGVNLAHSLDDALRFAASTPGPAFVIGGAALYAAALSRCARLHLTDLDVPVEGDTFFPAFDRSQWQLRAESRHEADDRHATGFWFRTYERIP